MIIVTIASHATSNAIISIQHNCTVGPTHNMRPQSVSQCVPAKPKYIH